MAGIIFSITGAIPEIDIFQPGDRVDVSMGRQIISVCHISECLVSISTDISWKPEQRTGLFTIQSNKVNVSLCDKGQVGWFVARGSSSVTQTHLLV